MAVVASKSCRRERSSGSSRVVTAPESPTLRVRWERNVFTPDGEHSKEVQHEEIENTPQAILAVLDESCRRRRKGPRTGLWFARIEQDEEYRLPPLLVEFMGPDGRVIVKEIEDPRIEFCRAYNESPLNRLAGRTVRPLK